MQQPLRACHYPHTYTASLTTTLKVLYNPSATPVSALLPYLDTNSGHMHLSNDLSKLTAHHDADTMYVTGVHERSEHMLGLHLAAVYQVGHNHCRAQDPLTQVENEAAYDLYLAVSPHPPHLQPVAAVIGGDHTSTTGTDKVKDKML